MSILKIKDEHGNWVDIPAIKGDKGDPGNPGKVQDVKVNGTSVVGSDGVANIQQSGGGGGENVADLNGLELNADNDEDAYLDIVLTDTRPVVLKNFYIKLNNGAKLHFDYVNSYQTLHDDLGNYYTFYFNDLWPGTGIFVSVEYAPQYEHPFYIYAWRSV